MSEVCAWCRSREGVNQAYHYAEDGTKVMHDRWYCEPCADSFEPVEDGDKE